jgi:DNA-binding GntR family transcriptional regulator
MFRVVPLLNEDHFAQLRGLIDQMKGCTQAEDFKQFMTLNRRFHLTIYEALGNQHLLETVTGLWERSELYRYRYVLVLHNAENVHREHEGILRACEAGDSALAKQLATEHILHTQQWLHEELAAAQPQDNQ